MARDVELKKGVGTPPRIAILKQLQTHFITKREKGVGTPFPRVPAPLHSWVWPLLRLVSVAQRNRPLIMLSFTVQSIDLPVEHIG